MDDEEIISHAMKLLANKRQPTKRTCQWLPCGISFEGKGRARFCCPQHEHADWRRRQKEKTDAVDA